ncbi:hypothetical protein J7E71_23320 [Mesobacillus foraminis]|uniref:hypothetical protein n=1 Tax=Mesobacillus foraminis TaxID=279826 RepID=UPI001BE67C73|nr:hypothetical protein [Mesobacillus foraminis]MBT2758805.1 hypothetical protein [Mesobacillus foraminis]
MNKKLVTGMLAAVLIAGGGFGYYQVSAAESVKTDGIGMNMSEMIGMMESGDMEQMMKEHKMNFGQMKSHMKEMHPEFTNKQLEEHCKSMHGAGKSSSSKQFQGMMNEM